MAKKRQTSVRSQAAYQPTPSEQVIIDRSAARMKDKAASKRLRVLKTEGQYVIDPEHADPGTGMLLLMDALGLSSPDLYQLLVNQIVNATAQGQNVSELALNGTLALIKSIQPRDDVEALLATQMMATHNLAMTFARRLANVDNLRQQDSAATAYVKLTRTFATQVATLKSYRSSGEQKIIVQRVDVREGGQAIVGAVHQSPRERGTTHENRDQPHALADSRSPSMLCEIQEERAEVQGAGGKR